VAVLVPGPDLLDFDRPFLEMCASTVSRMSEFYLMRDLLKPRGFDMSLFPFCYRVAELFVGFIPNYPKFKCIA
jgi:hypothetical protein